MNTTVNEADSKAEVTAAANAEADDTKEEKPETQDKEDAFPNRLDCKWKGENQKSPQPYEVIAPYGFDADDDEEEDWDEDEDEDDWNETPVSGIPRNIWKELCLEDNRINTEHAAIRSQLVTPSL